METMTPQTQAPKRKNSPRSLMCKQRHPGRWPIIARWVNVMGAGWLFFALAVGCSSLPCGGDCTSEQVCVSGACYVPCEGEQVRCGNECVILWDNPKHCGGCDRLCPPDKVCQQGRCEVGCPKDRATRCGAKCVHLQNDPEHCGACGQICVEGQSCLDGKCSCATGYERCDGVCVQLQNHIQHCGGCGNVCKSGTFCLRGACVQGDCPKSTPTLCFGGCTDLLTNRRHCGSCGKACDADKVCVDAACICAKGFDNCGGACADLQTNARHCGTCGESCPSGQLCSEGRCVNDCPAATPTTCFGGCIDTKSDLLHCGGCGKRCEPGLTCQEGICCHPGRAACGGACVDLQNDAKHCGACHKTCPGQGQCQLGVCCVGDQCSRASFFYGAKSPRIYDVMFSNGRLVIKGGFEQGTLRYDNNTLLSSTTPVTFVTRLDEKEKGVLWRQVVSLSSLSDLSQTGIASDASNQVYYGGTYSGSAKTGNTTLQAVGQSDIFINKFDPFGGLKWSKNLSGNSIESLYDIAATRAGDLYVVGSTQSSMILGQRAGYQAKTDGLLFRMSSDGAFSWSTLTGTTGSDALIRVLTDTSGNAYVLGITDNHGSAAVVVGSRRLTIGSASGTVLFKISPKGQILWARTLDGKERTARVRGQSIALKEGPKGTTLYVGGGYSGTMVVDKAFLPTSFGWSLFLMALDGSTGNTQWSKQVASPGVTLPDTTNGLTRLAIDSKGRIHGLISYSSPTLFIGQTKLVNIGADDDGALARFDENGDVLAVYPFGGTSSDRFSSMVIGPNDSTYIAGYSLGTNFFLLNKSVFSNPAGNFGFLLHIK